MVGLQQSALAPAAALVAANDSTRDNPMSNPSVTSPMRTTVNFDTGQ